MSEANEPRTLVLDIETTPNLAYVWGLWKQNVALSQLVEAGEILCFAARWTDRKRSEFHRVRQDDGTPDLDALQALWDMLDEADAVVTYNGDRFDLPIINRAFALAEMTPPSPFVSVDLLRTVRKRFRFVSNKLDNVLGEFGLQRKADTGGFGLWTACMAGDAAAWRRMRRYNLRDIATTLALYVRLTPWLTAHAHHGLYGHAPDEAGQHVCSRCGSTELGRKGYAYTPLGKYQQYRCKACGAWSRGKTALARVDIRGAA